MATTITDHSSSSDENTTLKEQQRTKGKRRRSFLDLCMASVSRCRSRNAGKSALPSKKSTDDKLDKVSMVSTITTVTNQPSDQSHVNKSFDVTCTEAENTTLDNSNTTLDSPKIALTNPKQGGIEQKQFQPLDATKLLTKSQENIPQKVENITKAKTPDTVPKQRPSWAHLIQNVILRKKDEKHEDSEDILEEKWENKLTFFDAVVLAVEEKQNQSPDLDYFAIPYNNNGASNASNKETNQSLITRACCNHETISESPDEVANNDKSEYRNEQNFEQRNKYKTEVMSEYPTVTARVKDCGKNEHISEQPIAPEERSSEKHQQSFESANGTSGYNSNAIIECNTTTEIAEWKPTTNNKKVKADQLQAETHYNAETDSATMPKQSSKATCEISACCQDTVSAWKQGTQCVKEYNAEEENLQESEHLDTNSPSCTVASDINQGVIKTSIPQSYGAKTGPPSKQEHETSPQVSWSTALNQTDIKSSTSSLLQGFQSTALKHSDSESVPVFDNSSVCIDNSQNSSKTNSTSLVYSDSSTQCNNYSTSPISTSLNTNKSPDNRSLSKPTGHIDPSFMEPRKGISQVVNQVVSAPQREVYCTEDKTLQPVVNMASKAPPSMANGTNQSQEEVCRSMFSDECNMNMESYELNCSQEDSNLDGEVKAESGLDRKAECGLESIAEGDWDLDSESTAKCGMDRGEKSGCDLDNETKAEYGLDSKSQRKRRFGEYSMVQPKIFDDSSDNKPTMLKDGLQVTETTILDIITESEDTPPKNNIPQQTPEANRKISLSPQRRTSIFQRIFGKKSPEIEIQAPEEGMKTSNSSETLDSLDMASDVKFEPKMRKKPKRKERRASTTEALAISIIAPRTVGRSESLREKSPSRQFNIHGLSAYRIEEGDEGGGYLMPGRGPQPKGRMRRFSNLEGIERMRSSSIQAASVSTVKVSNRQFYC